MSSSASLGGQHDDRHARLGPDDPADLDARELGQHQVEQDEVGAIGAEAVERLASVGGGDDAEALRLERLDERLAKGRLVVDDEDRACHRRRGYRRAVNGPIGGARTRRRAAAASPASDQRFRSMKYSTKSRQRPSSSKRSARRCRSSGPERARPAFVVAALADGDGPVPVDRVAARTSRPRAMSRARRGRAQPVRHDRVAARRSARPRGGSGTRRPR